MAETDNPIPDPTVLTTEQLLREIGTAEKLTDSKLVGLEGVINERFESVDTQFALVERQRVEQKKDTKDAVDAALAAAKEAVKEQTTASGLSITKSETATAEQLKQLNATLTTAINGVTTALNGVTTRVERIENIKQGGKESRTEIYAFTGFILTMVTLVGILAAAGVFK